jgi:polysaccharide biosynthesis protein PslG
VGIDKPVAILRRWSRHLRPPDMTAFDDFATTVDQRYCGEIKYYETWNEPNDQGYWSGTNAQLLTVAQHLYPIAKNPAKYGCGNGVCGPNSGANPNQLLMPPISRVASYSLTWLDSYLSDSGSPYPYADVAAFHGYGPTNPEDIATQVQSLNQILAKHDLSNLQLWNTEANWGSLAVVGQTQASWLMRYHVALATTGVSRFVFVCLRQLQLGHVVGRVLSRSPDAYRKRY